jgi:hypothetical protein
VSAIADGLRASIGPESRRLAGRPRTQEKDPCCAAP